LINSLGLHKTTWGWKCHSAAAPMGIVGDLDRLLTPSVSHMQSEMTPVAGLCRRTRPGCRTFLIDIARLPTSASASALGIQRHLTANLRRERHARAGPAPQEHAARVFAIWSRDLVCRNGRWSQMVGRRGLRRGVTAWWMAVSNR